MQRKGWPKPKWETIINIPGNKSICPWTLLQKYVAMTSSYVLQGATVFRALTPPYRPLQANTIGSITKQELAKLGIDISVWKPHATRGAGVTMYKNMGLTSEQVCEIGKWKNVSAFSSHYLRLGASNVAASKINELVHNVSPLETAESDLTCTPGRNNPGGSVREDGAVNNGEPTLPPFEVESMDNTLDHHEFCPLPLPNDNLTQVVSSLEGESLGIGISGEDPQPFLLLPSSELSRDFHVSSVARAGSMHDPSGSLCPMDLATSSVNVASSSTDLLPQPVSPLRLRSGKRLRSPGGSPPKKFVFASQKKKID